MKKFTWYSFLILISISSYGQNTKYPNTLLWRISGNGLEKSSYLFGTMHLQDKRLFNFGDSVYKGLESVEGFAIEIDFKEYLDSVFMSGIRQAEEAYLAEQKVKLNNKSLNKSTDTLFAKLGIDKNNLTKRDLKKIRDYRLNKVLQKGEMPTIVDGYLFGLALRQKKWVGAIEDVADQLYLFDELGSELTPDKVLQPEVTMQKAVDQMIRIYADQDLNAINAISNQYEDGYRDELLTRRNIKMARRIDSLTDFRSMFIAIGAAHLPGDSGVIQLLRSRGFTVEPVFSSKKIPATEYAKKLENIPWFKVHDENKLYTVEMPGNPSQFNEFGEVMKMNVFFDITTMTFYMAGRTIGMLKNASDYELMFKNMASRMRIDDVVRSNDVSREDMQGREAVMEKDGALFRIQLLQKNNSLFLLMAGSTKKQNLNTTDIGRFFSSFTAHSVATEKKERMRFSIPGKSFSLLLPGSPKKNTLIDRQAENTSWNFSSYDYIDNDKGLYYLLQVRDLKEGYFLTSDTVYFNSYVNDTKEKMDSVVRQDTARYKGFPALYYDTKYNKNITYKTLHIVRGSRVYLVAIGGMSQALDNEADSLFRSIEIEDYQEVEWKVRQSDGFSIYAPSEVKKIPKDSTDETAREHFIIYNEADAVSYEIFKEALPPFYWKKNDSSFFAERIESINNMGDSIITQQFSYTGKLKALDLIIQKPGSHLLEQQKLLVNGDTLYTLLCFMPSIYIHGEKPQRLFKDFKVTNEIIPTIYTNKTINLLRALKSEDSTTRKEAFDALSTANFEKEDLTLLHNALLENYSDSSDYYSIGDELAEVIEGLADSSTIDFVKTSYLTASDIIKARLLKVLANTYTKDSYAQLKTFLINHVPVNSDVSFLKYSLTDSLELALQLYPEILQLSKDSVFADILVGVNNVLLDTGFLKFADILPYEKDYHVHANNILKHLRKGADKWWTYYNWIPFLGKFNDKPSNEILQQMLALHETGLKMNTSLELLKNNQPVPASDISKVSADKSFRASYYDELKKRKKEIFFPLLYAKQQSLAESDLYMIAESEDYGQLSQTYLGEKLTDYEGKQQKFYLFKITFTTEEGKESYLGVAGPYLPNSKELVPYGSSTGIYWEEEFDNKNVKQQLEAYLK